MFARSSLLHSQEAGVLYMIIMKLCILLCTFLALAHCATVPTQTAETATESEVEQIPIISQELENSHNGSFTNNFETGNGITFAQHGNLKEIEVEEKPSQAQEISGSYSYTDPDGKLVKVDYIANEKGFQPVGDVLPVAPSPPPLPEAIARAIKFIEEHPPPPEKEEKSPSPKKDE